MFYEIQTMEHRIPVLLQVYGNFVETPGQEEMGVWAATAGWNVEVPMASYDDQRKPTLAEHWYLKCL